MGSRQYRIIGALAAAGMVMISTAAFADDDDVNFYSSKKPVDRFVFQVFEKTPLVRQMDLTSQATIERLLGKPTQISDQPADKSTSSAPDAIHSVLRTLHYTDLSVELSIETDGIVAISAIFVSGPQYALADGLKVGDPISKFQQALKQALVHSDSDPSIYTIEDDVLFSTSPASGDEAAYRVTIKTDASGKVMSAKWERFISLNEQD